MSKSLSISAFHTSPKTSVSTSNFGSLDIIRRGQLFRRGGRRNHWKQVAVFS
ncbi:hypothetical protein F2Q70_00010040 [Brassica cretica]|uniref:Uncharacterized protein n=1 Tax=Brassica cretica TaxID=69181 RepID=A0A8S9MG88_BRACR|nr:hypothetical protein F2Q70_00010040 [Brassica cretica]KAF3531176.1 hypothetical protein DY000_02038235 [Brassica cretica]